MERLGDIISGQGALFMKVKTNKALYFHGSFDLLCRSGGMKALESSGLASPVGHVQPLQEKRDAKEVERLSASTTPFLLEL